MSVAGRLVSKCFAKPEDGLEAAAGNMRELLASWFSPEATWPAEIRKDVGFIAQISAKPEEIDSESATALKERITTAQQGCWVSKPPYPGAELVFPNLCTSFAPLTQSH